jgi:xanthosine utilization system XapX-like protein
MAEDLNNRGLAMMLVGGLMVAFAVATIFLTENPAPSAIAIIGLVAIGVGARKRRPYRHI